MKIEQDRIKSVQRALMVIFFAQGVAALSWMPRIPEFIENLGVSKEVWGTLIGLGGIGAIIPLIFTNRLVQRFGTSPIIRTTSIAMIGLFMA
ncbi:MAG: MFS transporter, partial [bacterium]